MIIAYIIIILAVVVLWVDLWYCAKSDLFPFSVIVFALTLMGGVIFGVSNCINPIEVYRGNTALEITYRDGIPVDSVVVLKNNEQ